MIASSDHLSTHLSYALIYAGDSTREAVQTALRRRHTYAATDNITGTASIKEVSVIRNNRVIYRTSPNNRTAEIRYQADGNVVWSSPIWV